MVRARMARYPAVWKRVQRTGHHRTVHRKLHAGKSGHRACTAKMEPAGPALGRRRSSTVGDWVRPRNDHVTARLELQDPLCPTSRQIASIDDRRRHTFAVAGPEDEGMADTGT